MQVAIEVCGYTAVEADIFRKAMGCHRSHAKMQAERGRFVGGAMRTGLSEEDAEALFQKCTAFAEFGFARAHAAAFAKISYDTAWLKHYYPAHYTVGVLNNQPMGFYSPRSSSTTPSATGSGAADRRQRIGLGARHAATATARRHPAGAAPGQGDRRAGPPILERERAIGRTRRPRLRGPHAAGEQVVERLISIGAFDWTDAPRRELLWQLRTTLADADPEHPALGLTDDAQRALGASLPPMTSAEKVAADYRDTGVAPNLHAVELFRERLAGARRDHGGGCGPAARSVDDPAGRAWRSACSTR